VVEHPARAANTLRTADLVSEKASNIFSQAIQDSAQSVHVSLGDREGGRMTVRKHLLKNSYDLARGSDDGMTGRGAE
jgi:hypothetical protein